MSRTLRIVLLAAMGLTPFALPAQDAAPPDAGAPTGEPTPAPEVPAERPPEATLVAPADAMPSDGADASREDAAAVAAAAVDQDAADPPAGTAQAAAPESRPSLDAPPPPAPSVDVATGSLAAVEEVAAGRASNWFFLAVLVLAFVLIATRVKRTSDETLSIQEERSASPPVPPIVRRS